MIIIECYLSYFSEVIVLLLWKKIASDPQSSTGPNIQMYEPMMTIFIQTTTGRFVCVCAHARS